MLSVRIQAIDRKRTSTFLDLQPCRPLRVPGVVLGLVQDGKIVFADGFGTKELGHTKKPDGNTPFWDTPVITLLPSFRLGEAETTRGIQVKHLMCACTGMPRQDLERIFKFSGMTAASELALLGTMRPTCKFG